MDTTDSQDPAKSRPASNTHRNNPFLQNTPGELISPLDSTASAMQEDQAPSHANPDEKFNSPRPSRPKPGILSTFLNFGLNITPDRSEEGGNFGLPIPLPSIPVPTLNMKARRPSAIIRNVTEIDNRRKFILKLAKALMTFGAPSHRIESQLVAASKILDAQAEFVQLPNIIIVTIRNGSTASTRTYFVRARGRIALSRLNAVHHVYRKVLHDKLSAEAGTDALRELLTSPPVYNLWTRCCFSFTCASILCVLSFGGSFLDMWVSGCCAAVLQYLGLNAANKSSMYANVYEISVTIIVAFVARGLSNITARKFLLLQRDLIRRGGCNSSWVHGSYICAGIDVQERILWLCQDCLCHHLYVVPCAFFGWSNERVAKTIFNQGFGLTIGSDLYLVVDHRARRAYYSGPATMPPTDYHGVFQMLNGTNSGVPVSGTLGLTGESYETEHVIKGCFRDPHWSWVRQPFPWWTMLFLVPMYSASSSLSNLQSISTWNSRKQLAIMVVFSCCSYTANRGISYLLPTRPDIVSASGAFVIGCLGNLYSRLFRGTAFTSMVTGVLFLVPSGIAQGGGLTQTYKNSADQYSSGFSLALRMISVACGVTIGFSEPTLFLLFPVYLFGTRKNAAHFAF
ncbi:hypothetical protein MVEN_01895800 [Mycena venus]|uniref:Pheromone-regulated membrane protein 10 n=1 Tax=Mycena venus TaxID=2733690 RepID=A0A8H7CLJ9_9AGAR|nr:hypothetical protein MVEN_01895800 [Mycena venus]